jgi:hypothetical protein
MASAAALLIVLLPVLVSGPAMALSDEGSPSMALSAATFDAGKVKEGKKIDHTFEFENIGKGDLRILDIASGWGCTAAAPGGRIVKPGEKGRIDVTVSTLGYSGPLRHAVTVKTNDPKNQKVTLIVTAVVEKELIAEPPYVLLDDKDQEGVIVKTVKLKNVSDAPFTLLSIHIPNTFIEAESNVMTIQPGETAELTVRVLLDQIKNSKSPIPFLNTVIRIQTDRDYLPFINIWVRGPLRPVKR